MHSTIHVMVGFTKVTKLIGTQFCNRSGHVVRNPGSQPNMCRRCRSRFAPRTAQPREPHQPRGWKHWARGWARGGSGKRHGQIICLGVLTMLILGNQALLVGLQYDLGCGKCLLIPLWVWCQAVSTWNLADFHASCNPYIYIYTYVNKQTKQK